MKKFQVLKVIFYVSAVITFILGVVGYIIPLILAIISLFIYIDFFDAMVEIYGEVQKEFVIIHLTTALITILLLFKLCNMAESNKDLLKISKPFKTPKKQSYKYFIDCNGYEEFYKYVDSKLVKNSYSLSRSDKNDNLSLKIYTKYLKWNIIEIVSVVRVKELTNELMSELDNKMTEFFNEYKNLRKVYFVPIVVVDKKSKVFDEYIGTTPQDINFYRVPIGYSLGGKRLYIGKNNDGFQILRYRELKKRIISVLEIDKTKIKEVS